MSQDQTELLARVEAALARMEARGDHLREDFVLSDGSRKGYHNLKSIRDRMLAGEEFVSRSMRAEQAALIAHFGSLIPTAVSAFGQPAVHRRKASFDAAKHAANFMEAHA